eukprot:SAG31_NODE_21534_length_547_cov_0.714286_1_plen_99_part_00
MHKPFFIAKVAPSITAVPDSYRAVSHAEGAHKATRCDFKATVRSVDAEKFKDVRRQIEEADKQVYVSETGIPERISPPDVLVSDLHVLARHLQGDLSG